MKLKPEHFYKPEKPELYKCDIPFENSTEWELHIESAARIKDYKAKFVEPEINWISFSDREPEHGQLIYFAGLDRDAKIKRQWISDSERHAANEGVPLFIKGHDIYSKNAVWADAKSHDQANKLYEEHKQRYFGWEIQDRINGITFIKNDVNIRFSNEDLTISIEGKYTPIYNSKIGSVSWFEETCRINEIES